MTHMERASVVLPKGMAMGQDDPSFGPDNAHDGVSGPNITVRYTRLNHSPYRIQFTVNNSNPYPGLGWARVFLTPTFTWRNERQLMLEMDRFPIQVEAGKEVKVTRESKDSTIAMQLPDGIGFGSLDSWLEANGPWESKEDQFNTRGCGWPHNLLLPRGEPEPGATFQLVVLVTPLLPGEHLPSPEERVSGLCGAMGGDTRPMGFPFDREIPCEQGECQPGEWRGLLKYPNILATNVTILHSPSTSSSPSSSSTPAYTPTPSPASSMRAVRILLGLMASLALSYPVPNPL